MNFVVVEDAEALAARAADFLVEKLRAKPQLLLCAATGETPTRA